MSNLVLMGASRVAVARYRVVEALVGYGQDVVARARREQSGQDMVEYAGVLIVVAAILVAMLTFAKPIAQAIGNGIEQEVSKIFSHG